VFKISLTVQKVKLEKNRNCVFLHMCSA